MKSIATAAAALMLLATPIVTADSADAGHRHRSWVDNTTTTTAGTLIIASTTGRSSASGITGGSTAEGS